MLKIHVPFTHVLGPNNMYQQDRTFARVLETPFPIFNQVVNSSLGVIVLDEKLARRLQFITKIGFASTNERGLSNTAYSQNVSNQSVNFFLIPVAHFCFLSANY
jgi:hypothetical protein